MPFPCYTEDLPDSYFTLVQYTGWTLDPSWTNKLAELREQSRYLEDFLSKKGTILNALRDRETRNERLLSLNPTLRAKRKKI